MKDRSPPRARMVTPEAPVKVVKKAQTMTAIIERPPGSLPMNALKKSTRRSPLFPSDNMNPVKVNSGIAGMAEPVRRLYISFGITSGTLQFPANRINAAPPSRINMGSPKTVSITRNRTRKRSADSKKM